MKYLRCKVENVHLGWKLGGVVSFYDETQAQAFVDAEMAEMISESEYKKAIAPKGKVEKEEKDEKGKK